MTVSNMPTEIARKSQTLVLQALQTEKRQTQIAAAMDCSQSTVSRLKNEHLENFCLMLAHAGLKVVEPDAPVVDEEKLKAMILLFANDVSVERMFELVTRNKHE